MSVEAKTDAMIKAEQAMVDSEAAMNNAKDAIRTAQNRMIEAGREKARAILAHVLAHKNFEKNGMQGKAHIPNFLRHMEMKQIVYDSERRCAMCKDPKVGTKTTLVDLTESEDSMEILRMKYIDFNLEDILVCDYDDDNEKLHRPRNAAQRKDAKDDYDERVEWALEQFNQGHEVPFCAKCCNDRGFVFVRCVVCGTHISHCDDDVDKDGDIGNCTMFKTRVYLCKNCELSIECADCVNCKEKKLPTALSLGSFAGICTNCIMPGEVVQIAENLERINTVAVEEPQYLKDFFKKESKEESSDKYDDDDEDGLPVATGKRQHDDGDNDEDDASARKRKKE